MSERELITGGNPDDRPRIPFKSDFAGEDFLFNRDAEKLGEALIHKLPEFAIFGDLELKVAYLWKREGGKKQGRATLGTCTKAPGLVRLFSEQVDYVVAIAADNCFGMSMWQLEALVYHELKHIQIDTEMDDDGTIHFKKNMVGHDAEMFFAEVKRYGAWKRDLETLAAAYAQAPLFEPAEQRASA